MDKKLDKRISVSAEMSKFPFAKFKKLHEKDHPGDDAEARYLSIGGKIKKNKPEKE